MLSKLLKGSFVVTLATAIVLLTQLWLASYLSVDKALLAKFVYIEFFILSSMSLAVFGTEQGFINELATNPTHFPVSRLLSSAIIYTLLFVPMFLVFTSLSLTLTEYISLVSCGFLLILNQHVVYTLRYFEAFLISAVVERCFWIYFVLSILLIEIDIVWAATLSISVSFFSGLIIFYIFFLSKNAVSRLHFSFSSQKKSSIESVYLSATSYIVLFYERLDQFIISFFISPLALAAYFVSQKLSFSTKFLTRSIYQVLFPLLKRSDEILVPALYINIILAFFFSIVMIVFGNEILKFFDILDEQYVFALSFLSISVFISSLNTTLYQYINHKGGSKLYFRNAIFLLVLQTILMMPLAFLFSIKGMAVSRVIVSLVGAIKAKKDFVNTSGKKIDLKFFYTMLLILLIIGVFLEAVN